MLKKIGGYFLAVIGFIGSIYFRKYNGSLIPYPTLWLILSIAIGLAGLYLISLAETKKISKQEKLQKEKLNRLKQNGEKILMTVDNCEVRENNYYEEVINESSSRAQGNDSLYDPNRNYQQEYKEQSAIIYYYKTGNKDYKMTSQPFPLSSKALANYIEHKMILLYVNRFDKNDYAFDIIG